MTLDDLKSYRAIERPVVRGTLSRLRHRLDAAALLRRRASDPDAQHPRGFSAARQRRRIRRDAAPDDRGDETRLCGPRRISRRPGLRQGSGRGADLEALRRGAAQGDRSRARAARAIGPARHAGRARERQHHALFGGRSRRQRGRQHLHAQFQLRPRPRRRRHRHPAQQRARRFRRQAGRAECLRPDRRRRQRARRRQAPALLDGADDRARATAACSWSPARPAAAASSPWCCR